LLLAAPDTLGCAAAEKNFQAGDPTVGVAVTILPEWKVDSAPGATAWHGAAISNYRKGFVQITGEVGAGKKHTLPGVARATGQ
jgi:hypothetical protein